MIALGVTQALGRGVNLSKNTAGDEPMKRLTGWMSPGLAVLLFLCAAAAPADQDASNDAYLTGYIRAQLERQLLWTPDSFRIETHNGIATIILSTDQPGRARAAEHALVAVPGLRGLQVRTQSAGAVTTAPYSIQNPIGDLFPQLLADPKALQSFISFVHVNAAATDISAALVGIGGDYGFYRWRSKPDGYEWQMGIYAGVLSQFNLDTPSKDLVNTDYLIGFPLTFRRNTFSGRLRVFHQSSHLGDESILHGTLPPRVDVDYEAIDLLLAKDLANWRVYSGGEYIFRRTTIDLDRSSLLTGADYRSQSDVLLGARLVGGVHARWLQQRDWTAGTSVKIGLEFGQSEPMRRGSRLMLEAYKGYAPFGQFYAYDINYYGLGYYIDF
jgi:hypothetical protein